MQPLTEKTIRSSFLNASRSETKKLTLPENFSTLDWENLEYLGWRDPKMPQRGYLIHSNSTGQIRALLLRSADGLRKRSSVAMCDICRDVNIPCYVSMFSTRRAGQAGRDGDTLGTMICANFECSTNVRIPPPKNPIYPDPMVVVAERIKLLEERVNSFISRV
ncbi:FBP domain-containing protein [Glutamicibacter arilaitensis]